MKDTSIFNAFLIVLSFFIFCSCSDDPMNDLNTNNDLNKGLKLKPNIQVVDGVWSSSNTSCPDEILILEAQGGTAPYNWLIQGATILGGQGTSTLQVKTSSKPNGIIGYLYFKVTDNNGNYDVLTGETNHQGECDGSGDSNYCDLFPDSPICQGGGNPDE